MNVRQLIDLLLDQPMSNTVYVGDIAHGFTERHWDGELLDVTGSEPGVFATFLEFNETGLNGYIDTVGSETPAQVPGRTITESELIVEVDCAGLKHHENALRHALHHLGVTVVPEPTNADRWQQLVDRYTRESKQTETFAEWADRMGVKAPEAGGDDEH